MAQRSSASPDVAHLRSTANLQLESTLFGRLPPEIREMVYAECWVVSGLRQHVFLDCHGRQLGHSPCIRTSGEPDERNYEIQRLMSCRRRNRRGARSRSSVAVDRLWAARFSSDWHEHWPCEEMLPRTPEKVARNDHSSHSHRSLFLPILLLCKRTYIEALPSLYSSVTFIFTDIKSALRCLSSPFHPPTALLRSLIFSLALPFRTLHEQRDYYSPSLCDGPWARLCTTLSDMARLHRYAPLPSAST
ncbi:hypothetical protein EKO27_g10625 [Xylaria grammica]|uniref:DUF7730 domain-containing protein n=1 Tax=Xylaria grammica TaxID=363999 RepID=A0A439CQP9_9PEZI|nr:hypothetical protein EKO27_g10625 [Xylaria grammica]